MDRNMESQKRKSLFVRFNWINKAIRKVFCQSFPRFFKGVLTMVLTFQMTCFGNFLWAEEVLPPAQVEPQSQAQDIPQNALKEESLDSQVKHQEQRPSSIPAAVITMGGRGSGNDSDGYLDVLAPVLGSDAQFLFVNPKVSLSDDSENEENIGAGIRRILLDDRLIVGGNVFYDTKESDYGHRYDQLGIGVEFLTDWVDARVNYYLPDSTDKNIIGSQENQDTQVSVEESFYGPHFAEHEIRQTQIRTTTTTITTHHFDKFEQSMEGLDFEIGVKIPFVSKIAETRVFGGYYSYNSSFGNDLSGFKTRIEVRATPGLILDAEWYEDKEVHGSDYYVGARVRLPFEIGNLFKGKNPFEGAGEYFRRTPQTLKQRMTDMVMRDIDIVLEQSDFIEDKTKLKVDTTVNVETFNYTLLSDITFVDAVKAGGMQNGTFENPYDTIQKGVNNAFGSSLLVYVNNGDYKENVVLRDNVKLWGSGCVKYGIESGVQPTVNGRSYGPSFTLANNNEIYGFHIVNTEEGGPSIIRNVGGQTYDIRRTGIYAENKTDMDIHCNLFEANSDSVLLTADDIPNFQSYVYKNTFQYNDNGIVIYGNGVGSTLNTLIEENQISHNGYGMKIIAQNYENFMADVFDNDTSENGIGMSITSSGTTGESYTWLEGNISNGNTGNNIEINLSAVDGDIDVGIVENEFSNSVNLLGLDLKARVLSGTGTVEALIQNNIANDNQAENIKAELMSNNEDINVVILGNEASDSQNQSGIVLIGNANEGSVNVAIIENEANNNAGFNILSVLNALNGEVIAAIIQNEANQGGVAGIALDATATVTGGVTAVIAENVANGNFNENIKAELTSNNEDINVVILGNEASDSQNQRGIVLIGNANEGSINAAIIENKANNNAGFNMLSDLNSLNGDMMIAIIQNEANEGSIAGIVLDATATVSGDITAVVAENEANQNLMNISTSLTALAGDVTFVAVENKASQSIFGMMMQAVSYDGDLDVLIADNVVNNSTNSNIGAVLLASNGNLDFTVANNEANFSGQVGLLIDGVALNGNIDASFYGNKASQNVTKNLFVTLTTTGNIDLEVLDNTATGSTAGEGIFIDANSTTLGNINATIGNNHANNNNQTNISADFNAVSGNINVTVSGNSAENSVNGKGLYIQAVNGLGNITGTFDGNIANDNAQSNINAILNTSNGDIDVTISGNQANFSDQRGIDLIANVTSGTGSVIVRVDNNEASNNQWEGINADIDSRNDNIYAEYNGNITCSNTSGSGNPPGMNIFETVNGNGSIYTQINGNTSNGNDGTNIYSNFSANNGNIFLEMLGNNASYSSTGFGMQLPVTLTGLGDITITMASNIANNNAGPGIWLNALGPDNINVTLTSNIANYNGGHGIEVELRVPDAGDTINLFGAYNVVRNNTNDGMHLIFQDTDPTYNLDFGGGTLGSPGYNSLTSNTGYGMLHWYCGAVSAQYNYWLGNVAGNTVGTIDSSNPLAFDPNP